MKHLKLFETNALFEAARATLDLPNVSLIEEDFGIQFLPYVEQDPYNGHDYVEIGGIKWATMNVGANSITDPGLYFQWGDTQGYTASQVGSDSGQKYFGTNDYIYYNDGNYTKYNSTDNKTVLDTSDDAVVVNWGGQWRMPTKDEYVALGNAVNREWTADYQGSGVAGMIYTDKTDNSKVLFFPACGYCLSGGGGANVGSDGYYWSSSFDSSNAKTAYVLRFMSSYVNWQYNDYRHTGFPVRGVAD